MQSIAYTFDFGGGVTLDAGADDRRTKPLINLVWVGAILMLGSAFLSVFRRALDVRAMGKPAS